MVSDGIRLCASTAGLDGRSASWLTFAEIQAIDLDEPALRVDDRIHQFRRTAEAP